jgi:hypothetical protein
MKKDVGTAILTELSKAEITVKARQNKKPQNLLDLLDNDDLDVLFNGYQNLSEYKEALLILYNSFKIEITELARDCKEAFIEGLRRIKSKLSELTILLNPSEEEILLAHVAFKRNPRFVTEDYQLILIKKKY